MKVPSRMAPALRLALGSAVALGILTSPGAAQDRLKTMPGYDHYQKMAKERTDAFTTGALTVTWKDEGRALEYQRTGKLYRYDIATKQTTEVGPAQTDRGRGAPRLERGRQAASTTSPDGKRKAFHRDRNLWLSDASGGNEVAITKDGSEKDRIKYGTASWVYGEELNQTTAMWWSPDSTRVAYYRFDEKPVPDYLLQLDQTRLYSRIDTEAYPKAGQPNPIVDLYVFDVAAGRSVRVDVRDGKPFDNDAVGHYVYRISWSADGRELYFHRTNRRQNVLELAAANPATGACRVIVREEWPVSWVDNTPTLRFLADGKRFIWESERNGWKNYYLYDVSGKLIAPLTTYTTLEVAGISRVDEATGTLFYLARDGDNPMKVQLHRVRLDGTGDRRLTDPAFTHTVSISPDGRHVTDVAQTHDTPPITRLLDIEGRVIDVLAKSDLTKAERLGLRPVELFTYKAADGKTDLYGLLHKPSSFDPKKKYPVLAFVYGGPASNGASETFALSNARTEYGFLVVNLDSRSAAGRGKRFLDAIYCKLGVVEIDDLAAGVRSLWSRPYVDRERVGIQGTSYGGYASVMGLLRHPEVFQAAVAQSSVTGWQHYDSIYTERYMWIPQENKEGYEAADAVKLASQLEGRLMIYYGTADNNVHPSNSMQLIQALQRAGKSFEVQVGPDRGHTAVDGDRMMEFFIENLVLNRPAPPPPSGVRS